MSGLDGLGGPTKKTHCDQCGESLSFYDCRIYCARCSHEACSQCGSVRGYAPADMVDNGVGLEKCGPAHCEECGWIEPTFDEVLQSWNNQ
jgi:hypothetical protein